MNPRDAGNASDDDEHDTNSAEHAISASNPSDTSPPRNGVRPNIPRQRSSSTQVARPKIPNWKYEGSLRHKAAYLADEDAGGEASWDRSASGSPPPRPSMESGHSSRSSASTAQQTSSNTSPDPDLGTRKSFKRSQTVPTRPKIPGTWGEASAPSTSATTADPAPSSRFATNTIRRPYHTPGGIKVPIRPNTAGRTLSTSVSHGAVLAGTRSASSAYSKQTGGSGSGLNSSSGNEDDLPLRVPLPRSGTSSAVPHTSYQPRTLPLTQSASVGSMSVTPGPSLLRRPMLVDARYASDSPLPSPQPATADSNDVTMQMDLAMARLGALLHDSDDSDDAILNETEDADNTMSRKRKDPEQDSPIPSTSQSPILTTGMIRTSSASPPLSTLSRPAGQPSSSASAPSSQLPPIPPYRGHRARAASGAPSSTIPSIREPPLPPNEQQPQPPPSATINGKMLSGHSRSAAPLAARDPVPSHRRSPTAPSPGSSSPHYAVDSSGGEGYGGREWREGKENRLVDGVNVNGLGAQREDVQAPRVSAERELARRQALEYERDQREREQMELERRDRAPSRSERDRDEDQGNAERRPRERERERGRDSDEVDQQQQQQQQRPSSRNARSHPPNAERPAPPPPPAAAASAANGNGKEKDKKFLVVRNKQYLRLEYLGKGGTSRVYRVSDPATLKQYALKRVTLERSDADLIRGYQNEIQLLLRLKGKPGIINLVDYESNPRKNVIMLVLECGEIDLATLIHQRVGKPFDRNQVGVVWHQMLDAVHVIHEEKIVHTDLKPANFVMVRGELKLIDFGIAKAIANDTTNIQRDQHLGTPNYISPEAITENTFQDGKRIMKLGRASDVWSLGCILYQMVYGRPPFHGLTGMYPKMHAITDEKHNIDYPEYTYPLILGNADTPDKRIEDKGKRVPRDIVTSIKLCLVRDPKKRATIPELLDQPWISGEDTKPLLGPDESIISYKNMMQLITYLKSLPDLDDVEGMSAELMTNLKAVQRPL